MSKKKVTPNQTSVSRYAELLVTRKKLAFRALSAKQETILDATSRRNSSCTYTIDSLNPESFETTVVEQNGIWLIQVAFNQSSVPLRSIHGVQISFSLPEPLVDRDRLALILNNTIFEHIDTEVTKSLDPENSTCSVQILAEACEGGQSADYVIILAVDPSNIPNIGPGDIDISGTVSIAMIDDL